MDDKKVKILLGKRIKQLRQDLNLTQFVLGEKNRYQPTASCTN